MSDNDNFFVVFKWMTTELKLKGLKKEVYAIIYGFSQSNEGCFYGSLSYLSNLTGATTKAVWNALQNLTEKGFLIKRDIFKDNQKFCEYKAVKPDFETTPIEKNTKGGMKKLLNPIEETSTPHRKNFYEPIEESTYNNKYIINLKERENKEETLSPYLSNLFILWKSNNLLCRNESDFKQAFVKNQSSLKTLSESEISTAIKNYVKVKNSESWYAKTHNLTADSFFKNITQFLNGNFDIKNYVDKEDLEEPKEEEKIFYDKHNCLTCNCKTLYWKDTCFICKNCGATFTTTQIYG